MIKFLHFFVLRGLHYFFGNRANILFFPDHTNFIHNIFLIDML